MTKVQIRKLPTGVHGLDMVLGGGLPELSFNLIAGGPGCGKTTLAHQFAFANATTQRKALYFTIFGESPIKMLRYQQQFDFFDASKVDDAVRFVHLGTEMIEGGLKRVMDRITREIETTEARTVIVDSFRSVVRYAPALESTENPLSLEPFVQLLALKLTSYEATTFLVGEYMEQETSSNPVFTVADGIIWLYQRIIRNSSVRHIEVMKMRGQSTVPGLHTLKLTDAGVRIFPRMPNPEESRLVRSEEKKRTGVEGLDAMLGGGIPAGHSMLVVGPSGSGKTTLATQFILEGCRSEDPAVLAIFERRPEQYLRANSTAHLLERLIEDHRVKVVYIRPMDLSVDETLEELRAAVLELGAKRVVIDSLSAFELALAPAFRDDFRESLYRMVGALTNLGVTVMLTVEVTDSFTELRLSPHHVSFLTDGIILQRYVEIAGVMTKVMTVIKLRGANHRKEFRAYEITEDGIVIGDVLRAQRGILAGVPVELAAPRRPQPRRGAAKPRAKRGAKKRPR
jgi:circadian clock protein KaiC